MYNLNRNNYQSIIHNEDVFNFLDKLENNSVDLVIISFPPTIIDGYYEKVWKECERILKPNGKLCLITPPLLRSKNSHIAYHIQSELQPIILKNKSLYLLDLYIWKGTNFLKRASSENYLYPRNVLNDNTCKFITVYVKNGKPNIKNVSNEIKEKSKLTQKEWLEYTRQIWETPLFKKEGQIIERLIRLYSFVGDIILDPFAGTGTTLKVAQELGRKFVGYEIYHQNLQLYESDK